MVSFPRTRAIIIVFTEYRIETQDGHPADPTNVSRGVFGATVGVDRLLKLFSEHSILCTWFIPGHSIESFPDQMRKIRDAGHEM